MAAEVAIPTGLAINTSVPTDRTTPQGLRLALAGLLQQASAGVPKQGVLPAPGGALVVGGHASLMKYTITPGVAAIVRSGQGVYLLALPSAVTLDTLPADTTNPRIDRIFICQPDPELSDTGVARVGVVSGAAAATPAAPALPDGALELARKLVAASATNTLDGLPFTDVAPPTGANTSEVPWASLTGKPATFAPTIGSSSTQAVAGNDTRLSDARTPKAHTLDSHTGTLSVSKGGTGATSAAAARTALGAQPAGSYAAASHTHPSSQVILGGGGNNPLSDVLSSDGNNAWIQPPDGEGRIQVQNDGSLFFRPSGASWFLGGEGVAGFEQGTDTTGAFASSVDIYNRTYSNAANLYITSNGRIGRSTSSRRYKDGIEDAPEIDPRNVLKVRLRTWVDKAQKQRTLDDPVDGQTVDTLPRHFGAIAEELEPLLPHLVQHDEKGRPDSIDYSRLALDLIPLLREHDKLIADLKEQVAALTKRLDKK